MLRQIGDRTLVGWKLALVLLALGVMTACGTGAEAKESSQPTPTPKTEATFVSLEVTVAPTGSSESDETTSEPESTRGASRAFPELLQEEQVISVAQLLSAWEGFMFNGVMEFGNNSWELCNSERGLASGDLMNTNILWTIGPPREGMGWNEVLFNFWDVAEKVDHIYFLGYEDGTPVLKEISGYDLYDASKPWEYVGDPIPFEMYELIVCSNP